MAALQFPTIGIPASYLRNPTAIPTKIATDPVRIEKKILIHENPRAEMGGG